MHTHVKMFDKNFVREFAEKYSLLFELPEIRKFGVKTEEIVGITTQATNGAYGGIDGFVEVETNKGSFHFSCMDLDGNGDYINMTITQGKKMETFELHNLKKELFKEMNETAGEIVMGNRSSKEIR